MTWTVLETKITLFVTVCRSSLSSVVRRRVCQVLCFLPKFWVQWNSALIQRKEITTLTLLDMQRLSLFLSYTHCSLLISHLPLCCVVTLTPDSHNRWWSAHHNWWEKARWGMRKWTVRSLQQLKSTKSCEFLQLQCQKICQQMSFNLLLCQNKWKFSQFSKYCFRRGGRLFTYVCSVTSGLSGCSYLILTFSLGWYSLQILESWI